MRLINLFTPLAAAVTLFSTSCNKESDIQPVNEKAREANISLSILSAPATKALETENKLNTVEVFIFDNEPTSSSLGYLESYKKAGVDDFPTASSATLKFNATTGKKHIYVLANAVSTIGETVSTESALKTKFSELKDNSAGNFIMVGGAEVTLVSSQENDIALTCRRLVSKVSFGKIKGSFESPGLRRLSFKINRVYLMNVPKQAKFVNGSADDVFGTLGTTALTEGTNYPSIFQPALKEGSTFLPYYYFNPPAKSSSAANGMYNFFQETTFNSTQSVTLDNTASELTTENISSGVIYPSEETETTIAVNKNFYTYPNSVKASANDNTIDYTTKLVIETTLNINGADKKYYYPISLPYTQPNYLYNIDNVIIKRLGSDNPALPVTKAVCDFTVTVKDWDTGTIVGQFNNETSSGNFEF